MDNEKKILMEQVKELSKIVELKDEELLQKNTEIQKQRFEMQDMKLLLQTVQSRTEEIVKAERKSKEELNTANEIYETLRFFSADTEEREDRIDRKERDLQIRAEKLEQKEKKLKEKIIEMQNWEKTISGLQHRVYVQAAILGGLLLGVWLSAGLIGDLQRIVCFFGSWVSGMEGIAKGIPIFVIIFVVSGLIGGGCRCAHRYMDMVSLEVSFLVCLLGIMAKELFGLNSVVIVAAFEMTYVMIRSEIDARDPSSPFSRY